MLVIIHHFLELSIEGLVNSPVKAIYLQVVCPRLLVLKVCELYMVVKHLIADFLLLTLDVELEQVGYISA